MGVPEPAVWHGLVLAVCRLSWKFEAFLGIAPIDNIWNLHWIWFVFAKVMGMSICPKTGYTSTSGTCFCHTLAVLTVQFSIPHSMLWQGRPLRVHEYTFVSPWFLKAYMCIKKLSSRAFNRYMTLLYKHVIYIVGKLLKGAFWCQC